MGNKVYRKWRRKTSEDSYSLTDWLFHVRDFQCYFRFLLFCKTVASLAANRDYGQRLNATLIKNNLKLTTTVFIMGTWVKCRNKPTTKQGTAHEEFINETRSPLLFPNWILTIYEVQIRSIFPRFSRIRSNFVSFVTDRYCRIWSHHFLYNRKCIERRQNFILKVYSHNWQYVCRWEISYSFVIIDRKRRISSVYFEIKVEYLFITIVTTNYILSLYFVTRVCSKKV